MSQERFLTDTIRVQTIEIERLKAMLTYAQDALRQIASLKDEPVSRRPIQLAHEYLKGAK